MASLHETDRVVESIQGKKTIAFSPLSPHDSCRIIDIEKVVKEEKTSQY